jgi:hypothetical protein
MAKLVAVFAGNVGITNRIWLTEEDLWTYIIATLACATGIQQALLWPHSFENLLTRDEYKSGASPRMEAPCKPR